ncbi:MAG: DUF4491 family protein [Bacteroidales bacterium]|nr:DUF4491 family protein [Bacteroidales bacterium]
MNYTGLLVGLGAFACIGLFHPLVIKAEYHLGVFGFSSFWSIHELFKQKERVQKGWFPAKPKSSKNVRMLIVFFALFAQTAIPAPAQTPSSQVQVPEPAHAQERKGIYQGFDGGMMLHTGYLQTNIAPLGNYRADGAPFGIGGVARIHLGKHWRVGGEGYISTLSQLNNGSYIECGWGGVLADFYWIFGRFQPYVGLTIGGGALTHYLMFEEPASPWAPVGKTYFEEQGFMAIDPFVGCEFALTSVLHLNLKMDYLCAIGPAAATMPTGPRVYFGILFHR